MSARSGGLGTAAKRGDRGGTGEILILRHLTVSLPHCSSFSDKNSVPISLKNELLIE